MEKIIIVGAVAEEFSMLFGALKLTGIGNDTTKFKEIIKKAQAEGGVTAVINVGTCVAKKAELVGEVIAPYIIVSPDTKCSIKNGRMFDINTDYTLRTSDTFVTGPTTADGSIIDMEAYFQAKVCLELGIQYQTIKVVTEALEGGTSVEGWRHACKWAKFKCAKIVEDILYPSSSQLCSY